MRNDNSKDKASLISRQVTAYLILFWKNQLKQLIFLKNMINQQNQHNAAQTIVQAGLLYISQLRNMMAPMFCSVSVLSHLAGAKNKLRINVESHLIFFNETEQAQILDLIEQMIDVHDDDLAVKLPLIAKKQSELKLFLDKFIFLPAE